MHSLNSDSVEVLQRIYTLHKRVAAIALVLLSLIVLAQLFWIVLYFQFAAGMRDIGEALDQTKVEGFKTLEQLNAERPRIPKKFD